jgi:hypothetical protein
MRIVPALSTESPKRAVRFMSKYWDVRSNNRGRGRTMKISRLSRAPRAFAWGTILLVVILSDSDMAFANPGLVRGWDEAVYVDFSDLPGGNPIRQGIDVWQAKSWNGGALCVQRLCTASVPHKETIP